MKRKLTIIIVVIILVATVSLTAYAQSRDTAPPPILSYECPAGQTCHILWGAGSQGYNLCAGANGQTGRFNLEIYGADSNLLQCVGAYD